MKKLFTLCFIVIFINSCLVTASHAKKDSFAGSSDASYTMLKSIVEDGYEARTNDVPIEKADISKDITLAAEKKQAFYEENRDLLEMNHKPKIKKKQNRITRFIYDVLY